MNYDPLTEITMPDLTESLAEPEQPEATLDSEELEDQEVELDVDAISEKLSGLYPEVEVAEPEVAEVTEAKPAGKTEQELLAEDMYMKDPLSKSGLNESNNFVDLGLDLLSAPGAGLNDYFNDEFNKIPGVNLRRAPKYENEVAQSIRELSSFILPFLMLRQAGKQAVGTLAATKPATAISTRFPKTSRAGSWMAELGIDTSVGAYVDATNKLNSVDDNLAGWLKKSWPMTYRWIPSDWATLDGESPDVWAAKNRNEGVMLGFTASWLEASVKLILLFVVHAT